VYCQLISVVMKWVVIHICATHYLLLRDEAMRKYAEVSAFSNFFPLLPSEIVVNTVYLLSGG